MSLCLETLVFFTFKVWVLSWFSDSKYPPQALVMRGWFPTGGGAGSILEGPRNFRIWYLIAAGSMDLKVILGPSPVPCSLLSTHHEVNILLYTLFLSSV